jgi:hypothetical protein
MRQAHGSLPQTSYVSRVSAGNRSLSVQRAGSLDERYPPGRISKADYEQVVVAAGRQMV